MPENIPKSAPEKLMNLILIVSLKSGNMIPIISPIRDSASVREIKTSRKAVAVFKHMRIFHMA